MKRTSLSIGALGAAMLSLSSVAAAQNGTLSSQCQTGNVDARLQDACQKSQDVFNFMAPQLGTAIAGGNAVLGQSGTVGLFHFSIGLRANVISGSLPQTKNVGVSTTGATRSDFGDKTQALPAPAAELEVGVFPGIPLALTSVGSLDAIVSANYIPDYNNSSIDIKTDGSALKFGFGGRLGILKESILVPGVSITYLRRDLPTVSVTGPLGNSGSAANDTLGVSALSVKTGALRGVIGKKLGIFGLSVGIGQDKYDSRATLTAVVHGDDLLGACTSAGGCRLSVTSPKQSLTRTSYFADLSLNLVILKLVGEIGQVSGGSAAASYNSFGTARADDSRTYGSIGLRFGY